MLKDTLSSITIVGKTIRTSHDKAGADIGALWASVAGCGLLNGADRAYAVYHQYNVSEAGYEVSVTVGKLGESQDGFDTVSVPTQDAVRFDTDGSIPQVTKAWMDVWQRWPDGGPRSFVSDVECWHMNENGEPTAAEIFVGITA